VILRNARCSKNDVEAYYWNKLIENSASFWFILYRYLQYVYKLLPQLMSSRGISSRYSMWSILYRAMLDHIAQYSIYFTPHSLIWLTCIQRGWVILGIVCWTCVPLFKWTPWGWRSGAKTCRNWLFTICILLSAFLANILEKQMSVSQELASHYKQSCYF